MPVFWRAERRVGELTQYRAAGSTEVIDLVSSEEEDESDVPFAIAQTRLRNKMEWSLVATRPIAAGTCLGFFAGEFRSSGGESLYAASLLPGVDVHPFADERQISAAERRARPFANMNEPNEREAATCCMLVRDFAAAEIDGVEHIPDYARALFFRALACFTCRDIGAGEALTWHYGQSYEPNRRAQGYSAGTACTYDQTERIPQDAVFRAFPKVPWRVVHPVFAQLRSARFAAKKKKRPEDEEDDTDSSGSGHAPKYTPRDEDRVDRNERRREARERQLGQA